MNDASTIFLRFPNGEQFQQAFAIAPRVGEKIYVSDGKFRVVAVEFRQFPNLGPTFFPVIVLEDITEKEVAVRR